MEGKIPVSDWFLFRQEEATSYLKKVLREVRWKSSDDPIFDKLGLSATGSLVTVRKTPRSVPGQVHRDCWGRTHRDCWYGCRCNPPNTVCTFLFEMDRGRIGMGHPYELELGPDGISFRMASKETVRKFDGIDGVTPEALLDAIRECFIQEIAER